MARKPSENKQEQQEKEQQQNAQIDQPKQSTPEDTDQTKDENPAPEEQPEEVNVNWAVNVKYRGKRFRAGERTEIQVGDYESLAADGLIKVKEE